MDVDANAVIEALKNQRNAAQDEVAMLRAVIAQLQKEAGEKGEGDS